MDEWFYLKEESSFTPSNDLSLDMMTKGRRKRQSSTLIRERLSYTRLFYTLLKTSLKNSLNHILEVRRKREEKRRERERKDSLPSRCSMSLWPGSYWIYSTQRDG